MLLGFILKKKNSPSGDYSKLNLRHRSAPAEPKADLDRLDPMNTQRVQSTYIVD